MLTRLAIAGYRSLRELVLPLAPLNVVTGANGSGKSSLYRGLRLLADVAQGNIVRSLADEGGLQSALWAGPETIGRAVREGRHPAQGTRRRAPIGLRLGFASETYSYAIDLGLPQPGRSLFSRDPQIKTESVWIGEKMTRASVIAERHGPAVRVRDEAGAWRTTMTTLSPRDSMMTHCADPRDAVELLALREQMRSWRFYDHLRADREAPARRPQVGTYTPVLASDGSDLAAAVQTIIEIGDAERFERVIDRAFPGAQVDVSVSNGYFEIEMRQHGLLRPLTAEELSDGTLRYLLLTTALMSPRPPELMILNEPETSLHPDLIAPLAELIIEAAQRTQVMVVSHAGQLVDALGTGGAAQPITLSKGFGETHADVDAPSWSWPTR